MAKVHPELVYVTMDVPRDEIIQLWAGTAYKPLAGCLVFYDAKGGPALETLSWTEGHCVGYQEEFRSGNDQEGAYVCHLTIAATVLTWQAGGPGSYRAPTPREHGQPASAAAALLATAKLKAEEAATGLLKKVITPAGEVGSEFLGVGLAATARTASLTVGLLLTPTNSRDDPGYASEWELYRRTHAQFKPLTPDQLRLAQLERLHAQGDLTAKEEAELLGLLGKVKGIHVQRLSDLEVFGTYKGQPVGLPGFHYEEISYTKRDPAATTALRRKFNSVREAFVKKISTDPTTVAALQAAGLDDNALNLMRNGEVPAGYQVHHQLPLDDSGDNSFDNLIFIQQTPYHSVITTHQLRVTGKLKPGQTGIVQWPFYRGGIVYPPRKP